MQALGEVADADQLDLLLDVEESLNLEPRLEGSVDFLPLDEHIHDHE